MTAPAAAQSRSIPSPGYDAAFGEFYDGDYRAALDRFTNEGRGAIKTMQSRWIDSICYETMVGECYYGMGHLGEALDHYTAAVKLAAAFPDWMMRVQWPAIRPAGASLRAAATWGASKRRAELAFYPHTMLIGQGQIDLSPVLQQGGGVAQTPTLVPVQVQEIVRCTALAIRRRTKLLGPLAPRDPLFRDLAAAFSRRIGPPNHWSEAWTGAELGTAMAAVGQEGQALLYLQRSVVAQGQYDHPLTSVILFELGRLAMIRGDFSKATDFFEEASYSAVSYPDPGILEESFRYGAMAHLLANRKGLFPPLLPAIQWAKANHLRQFWASLLLLAAENYAVLAQTGDAASMLDEARAAMGRRTMGTMANGRLGARLSFLRGLVCFQEKRVGEGESAVKEAMSYMLHGSHWLFQISLADGMAPGQRHPAHGDGPLPERPSRSVGGGLGLRSDGVVGRARHAAPRAVRALVRRRLGRKDHEAAIEIGDRLKRHRFFTSLPGPLGARLLSLRWVLEAADESLDAQSQLQRDDLMRRYPAYEQLHRRAAALRANLAALPLASEDKNVVRQQTEGLSQLTAISQRQEVILREMAVRREPAALVFPPLRTTADIQKSLAKGQALLIFVNANRSLYGFLLNREKYGLWQLAAPTLLSRQLVALLHDMGNFQANGELKLKDLEDKKWKQAGHDLLDAILKGSHADLGESFDELIVVPDGVLWYLPFEALEVKVKGERQPLIAHVRVRYAPTASLATPWERRIGRGALDSTAVVLGRLFPKDNEATSQAAMKQLSEALPGCVAVHAPLPGPSAVYAALLRRLIVFDDFNFGAETGPYSWSPLPLDRAKAGGTLADWILLPWGAPDQVILPGWHTAAEDALKHVGKSPLPGNEMFLSVCGLLASGVRTVLLSRWRSGGQTSYDLVREFAQELPHTAPSDAWQRAVFVVSDSRLNLDGEPRLKKASVEDPPKASHPFFWGGYMLIDSGVASTRQAAPKAAVPKVKKPEAPPDRQNPAKKPRG